MKPNTRENHFFKLTIPYTLQVRQTGNDAKYFAGTIFAETKEMYKTRVAERF